MDGFEQATRTVQFLSVDAVEKAKSGHPGTPMGLAAIGVEIFARQLRYLPSDPSWPNRDRFVLSCGHASMLLYSLLHLSGYAISHQDLQQFRQWQSITPGHPEFGMTPGVETTTGPLGQGFGNAVGMALAGKMLAARVNTPESTLIDYRVFVIASDGDLMEGVAGEAASLAGHLGLDNLIVVYDDNRITIDGAADLSFSENVQGRFEALGWFVQRVDGHAPQEVRTAFDAAVLETQRPALIIARTEIAHGAPTKHGTAAAHGAPLGETEVKAAKQAANWPLEPKFHVPDGATTIFAEQVQRNRALYEAWQQRLAALTPADRQKWLQFAGEHVPADIYEQLLAASRPKADATRSLASEIQQVAAKLIPALVGGSADLASSTKTTIEGATDIKRGDFSGRNLHFGIREHGMAAILNGMALSGFFVPYGSTFLIFSDYLRPSLRLASLMHQRVVFVFTHDSIFVGEDGPTHQPIEQLASMRLIPGVRVFRPADALECAAVWALALARKSGPSVLSLTRQKLPILTRPQDFDVNKLKDGAYVLSDVDAPELVLIATGSEVHVAVEAQQILARAGRRIRVVSAPCLEHFLELPAATRDAVLPPGLRRVSFEAGSPALWQAVVGEKGLALGLTHFGASAPFEILAEQFGLGAQTVAQRISEYLKQN